MTVPKLITEVFPSLDCAHIEFQVSINRVVGYIDGIAEEDHMDLDPEFQRSHVWTEAQQVAYMEWALSEGPGARTLYFNNPCYSGYRDPKNFERGTLSLVDGKQRLEAIRAFFDGRIRLLDGTVGHEDILRASYNRIRITIKIAELETYDEVLDWYLRLNAGGTPHTQDELERVRKLRTGIKNKMSEAEALVAITEAEEALAEAVAEASRAHKAAIEASDHRRATWIQHRRVRYEARGLTFSPKTKNVKRGTKVLVNGNDIIPNGTTCIVHRTHQAITEDWVGDRNGSYDPEAELVLWVKFSHYAYRRKASTVKLSSDQWTVVK